MRKTEYKSKYKELVRAGKVDEANKMLESYRSSGSWDGKIVVATKVKKKVEIKPIKEITIDSLVKISGIGSKTIKDIKRIYKSLDELREAINNDKAPFRDDIVSKLKEELN